MYSKLDVRILAYMFEHYGYVFACNGDAQAVDFDGGDL